MKKLTTEEFIEKAKKIHGEKYSYKHTDYKKSSLSVTITCKIHGEFEQIANTHLSGAGCKTCANKLIGDKIRREKGEFIEISKKVHNNFYDYSKTVYTISSEKVTITCPKHGDFEQEANSHLQGHGCYDCGVVKTSEKKVLSFSIFKKEIFKIHGDTYEYKEGSYKGMASDIQIMCKKHGLFTQSVPNHLKGQGCPRCGNDSRLIKMKECPPSWGYSAWQKAGEKSKNFDSFKVYVIRCWDDNEEFYKIGRTYLKIKGRFHNKKALPYNYEIVKEIPLENARIICELEEVLKNCNKGNKYIPKNIFGGRYECFKELDLSCFEEINTKYK